MNRLVTLIAACACLCLASSVWAGDFVVIINKANTSSIDKAAVLGVFTGQKKSWDDGQAAMPVDLPEDSPVRASFSSEILGKTVANLKALWAQMVFSGKALPPRTAASDDDVKKLVSANKGAIGYIKASSADDSVKVALK